MSHANFILSTCGTALLTNPLDQQSRQRINRHANTSKADQIPTEDREWLITLVNEMQNRMETAELNNVAKMSAELNGLIKFYGGKIESNHDYHLLLCTDTW